MLRKTYRHRLVSTPDLDGEVGRLVAVAGRVAALDALLGRIVPGARAAEDVLLLDAREVAPAVDGLLDGVLVRAGAALEAVAARLHGRDGEDVGAVGADCYTVSRWGVWEGMREWEVDVQSSILAGCGGAQRMIGLRTVARIREEAGWPPQSRC